MHTDDELGPPPVDGRVISGARRVRLGHTDPQGRIRLDALAGLLQDISNEDVTAAALPDALAWVARRLVVRVERFPVFGEHLTLSTWCNGLGSRWAQRRVMVRGERGGSADAATIWVSIDEQTGRPKPLTEQFQELYGPSAQGRTVRPRLVHPAPDGDVRRETWPLRTSDFDVLGHVNNAAYWHAFEEVVVRYPELDEPLLGELEFHHEIGPGESVELQSRYEREARCLRMWLVVNDQVHASSVVRSI